MLSIDNHPQRNTIRLQLKQSLVLSNMPAAAWSALEPLLEIADFGKGDLLVRQGHSAMEQFFILDGILKRVVSDAKGKEMILRFAAETDMDTSYAAWRLGTPMPYSIVAVTKVRVAKLSMQHWVEFLERQRRAQSAFRVRDHEPDVRSDGAHHHLASARRARAAGAVQAQTSGFVRAHPEEGTRLVS